jgi:hypothetical protein
MGKYNYAAEETGILTFFNVERRFHPQFDVRTFDHDYALVKLGREHPDPHLVQLRNTSEIPETLTIMGWGLTKENGDQSDILLEGTVRRFNTSECRQRLEPDPVTENMFCAWEDGVDTCQGKEECLDWFVAPKERKLSDFVLLLRGFWWANYYQGHQRTGRDHVVGYRLCEYDIAWSLRTH